MVKTLFVTYDVVIEVPFDPTHEEADRIANEVFVTTLLGEGEIKSITPRDWDWK